MNKNLLIFIVIALVILGIVYYFSSLTTPAVDTGSESITGDTSAQALEQELTNTDFDNLDQEFADIEMELEAAVSEAQ